MSNQSMSTQIVMKRRHTMDISWFVSCW